MSFKPDVCPVPFDQQPLNEYEALKKSPIFNWSTQNNAQFMQQLLLLFFGLILTLCMLSINKISALIVLDNLVIAIFLIEVILIRLYLGWSYIFKRLASATVFYEESGWYDGQLWVKSAELLTKDRLIGIYQVEPILLRVKNIFFVTSIILLIVCMLNGQLK